VKYHLHNPEKHSRAGVRIRVGMMNDTSNMASSSIIIFITGLVSRINDDAAFLAVIVPVDNSIKAWRSRQSRDRARAWRVGVMAYFMSALGTRGEAASGVVGVARAAAVSGAQLMSSAPMLRYNQHGEKKKKKI